MIQVFRYIKGYLSIRVSGFSTERFMNLCSHHNIVLWDIVNYGEYYTMNISISGFFALRAITRKTGTKVVITGRYGLPFFCKRIKRKKVFIISGIVAILMVFWMQSFVWDIEVEGNYSVTEDVYMDFLTEQNIHVGMSKKQLDIELLEKETRNRFDEITWTSAKLEGNKLLIRWKENTLPDRNLNNQIQEGGYDLIADKGGCVLSIITRKGVPKVKEGDVVKAGDVLVEGKVPIFEEDGTVRYYEYCVADADIKLQFPISAKEKYPEIYEKHHYTGKEKRQFYLQFKDKVIHLFPIKVNYGNYDCIDEKKSIDVVNRKEFPLYFGVKTYREYEKETLKYSVEEMKQKIKERGIKIIQTLEEKGVQIIEKNVTISKENRYYKMGIDLIVAQEVGIKSKTQRQEVSEDSKQEFVKEN